MGIVMEDKDCELEPDKEPESERECDELPEEFPIRGGCRGWKGGGFRDFADES